jgi:hypothetical protein
MSKKTHRDDHKAKSVLIGDRPLQEDSGLGVGTVLPSLHSEIIDVVEGEEPVVDGTYDPDFTFVNAKLKDIRRCNNSCARPTTCDWR